MKHRKICSYANLSPNFSLTFTFFSACSSSFCALSLLLWFYCCCVAGNFFCGLCFLPHSLGIVCLSWLLSFSCCLPSPVAASLGRTLAQTVLPINRRNTLSQGYELLVNVTRRVPTLPTLPNFWLTCPSGECFLCFLFYLHLLLPLTLSVSLSRFPHNFFDA